MAFLSVSHLSLLLRCKIALRNPFSHNKSTILYIYQHIDKGRSEMASFLLKHVNVFLKVNRIVFENKNC